MATINVKDIKINIITNELGSYVFITDMLKSKDGDFFVSDWLRNRNTIEFLGIWESIYNPNFNYGEYAIIKDKSGLNNYKISVKELICLSNLENANSVYINEGMKQHERIAKLNEIAISQMKILTKEKEKLKK